MARLLGFALLALGVVLELHAGSLEVLVEDPAGNPIADAVVYARARAAGADGTGAATGDRRALGGQPRQATIAQQGLEFVPYVTAIPVGSTVRFPNRDRILHNVYSFSRAKRFQLPLYKHEPPDPVLFDKPGVVTLGCNIHDWMVAYVYVLETPYFSKTGAGGRATVGGLPAGEYTVQVWHPRKRKRGSSPGRRLRVAVQEATRARFVVTLRPEWRPRRNAGVK